MTKTLNTLLVAALGAAIAVMTLQLIDASSRSRRIKSSVYSPAYCLNLPNDEAWAIGEDGMSVAANCLIKAAVRSRSKNSCELLLMFPVEGGYTNVVGETRYRTCVDRVEKFLSKEFFRDDPTIDYGYFWQ